MYIFLGLGIFEFLGCEFNVSFCNIFVDFKKKIMWVKELIDFLS